MLSESAGDPCDPKLDDKMEPDSAPTPSAQPGASSASTKGRAASQGRVKKGNLSLDLAQVQWLRTVDNGAFLENETIKLLRSTKPKSKYPYNTVVSIVRTVVDMTKVGWLPDTAPEIARGTKIRYSAIGRFIGRGAGWVGSAVKLNDQLEAYKMHPEVRSQLRKHRDGLVGVKTLLKAIKDAVDGGEDGEGDGDGDGVHGEEDEEEDEEEEVNENENEKARGDNESPDGEDADFYEAEMPPRGVNYGRRIIEDSESDGDMD